VVNIGFSLDVGEDKVECSFEDIKWTGRESILAETRTRKETIENRKNFFNYEFLFLVVETKYLMLNFVE
jgi:hypothetical protein